MLARVLVPGGVENRLHWRLNVVFGEDQRRIRSGQAAETFSRLNRIALNLLNAGPPRARSIPVRRLLAGWDDDDLLSRLVHEPEPKN